MTAGYLVDLGSCFDLPAARLAAATVAVEELWTAVPDGRDRFGVADLLAMRDRVVDELGDRVGVTGVTLAAIARLLEEAGHPDEALALTVDATYRDVRDRVAEPLPGAEEALRRLVDRFRVAIVAVGFVDWRRLAVDVDTVIVPRAMALHRGDVAVVERAAARLGVGVAELSVVAPTGSPLLAAAAGAGAAAIPTGAGGIALAEL
jgi:predicted HAD superfamily phosphohydrolase